MVQCMIRTSFTINILIVCLRLYWVYKSESSNGIMFHSPHYFNVKLDVDSNALMDIFPCYKAEISQTFLTLCTQNYWLMSWSWSARLGHVINVSSAPRPIRMGVWRVSHMYSRSISLRLGGTVAYDLGVKTSHRYHWTGERRLHSRLYCYFLLM